MLIPQSVAREFGLAKILANVETFRNDCERIDRDWGRSIAGKENGGWRSRRFTLSRAACA
jgi:hypothetical protein